MKMKNIFLYPIVFGLFLIPFIAFIVPDNMYFPFISGKGFAFRILVEILFALYLLLAVYEPHFRPRWSWISKAVMLFVGVILVADLFGVNAYKSIWSNYERMEGFVLIAHLALYYFVLTGVLRTEMWWNRFWNVVLGSGVIMSLYGVGQLLGIVDINQGGVRVDGTFGNASYFAIYLVFNIFLCAYMYMRNKELWMKWTYAGMAVLHVIVLYFTATRGAILGLIGGVALAGLLVAFKEKENKKIRKWAYGVLIGIIVFVGLFILVRNVPFIKNNQVLSRFTSLNIAELKTQGRYFVWPMAMKGIAERPILGWGQENFNFVFNKNYNPQMFGQEEWFDRTHNVILDWMIAGGIVGFLAYASLYVALLYVLWRKNSTLTLAEKSICTGMIVAYVFHNMFVFDNLFSYIFFFSLLAYVHSLSVAHHHNEGEDHGKISIELKHYIIAPIVIIASVFTIYTVNIPALRANQTLIEAMKPQPQGGVDKNLNLFKQAFDYNSFGSSEALEQLVQVSLQIIPASQIPDSIKQQFYDFAKIKIEEKIARTPNDARYLMLAGGFYNRFKQYDEAIPYLEKAIEASPNKQTIYFELGSSYLGKGMPDKMFEVFKKAYDLKPTSTESKIIYVAGAIYTRNVAVLKEILPTISPEVLELDNRILNAFADVGDFQSVIYILTARLQKDPDNAQYNLSLASTYLSMGQKQKAIEIIEAMIKKNPEFRSQGEIYITQIKNS
jgi:O-antigen ligase/tetratricopeptide (TPR) repeat protein